MSVYDFFDVNGCIGIGTEGEGGTECEIQIRKER